MELLGSLFFARLNLFPTILTGSNQPPHDGQQCIDAMINGTFVLYSQVRRRTPRPNLASRLDAPRLARASAEMCIW